MKVITLEDCSGKNQKIFFCLFNLIFWHGDVAMTRYFCNIQHFCAAGPV